MRSNVIIARLFLLSSCISISFAHPREAKAEETKRVDLRRVALVGDAAVRLSKLADATSSDATTGTGAIGVDFVTKWFHVQALYVLGTARSVSGAAGDEGFGRSLLLPNTAPNSFMLDTRASFRYGVGIHSYINASGSDWALDTKGTDGNISKASASVTQLSMGIAASYQLNLTDLMVPNNGTLPDIQLIFDLGYSLRYIDGDGSVIGGALRLNGRVFHGIEPTVAFQLNIFRFFASLPVFYASEGDVSVAGLHGAHFVIGVGINGPLVSLWSKGPAGKTAIVKLGSAPEPEPAAGGR